MHYQYIWIIRYGRTFPGLVENVGNYDSDLHQPEGIEHAKAIAQRIIEANSEKGDHNDDSMIPKHVFSDPFLRCMRTADVLVTTLNEHRRMNDSTAPSIKIKVEEGTTEWQVPSLLVDKDGKRTHPRTLSKLVEEFPKTIDETYESLNPQGPDREDNNTTIAAVGCPRFPETEDQLHERCRATLEKMLGHVGNEESIAVVGHAPCVQSIAMALEGAASPAQSKLGPWSLGGVTLFSRPIGGATSAPWKLECYSETSHMPGEYKEGKLGQWSLPSFVRE